MFTRDDGDAPQAHRTRWWDRLPHDDDQRARRSRLGRWRDRGRGGDAGSSRSRCCCRRSSGSARRRAAGGSTATDLVLTVTEMLRERGVVGKFVEFHGPGLHTLGLADRATIGNMSLEFGSTCAIFPVDRETLRYLEFTGRPTTSRARRRLRPRAGDVPPRSRRSPRSPRRSSSTSARCSHRSRGRSGPRTRSPSATPVPGVPRVAERVRPRRGQGAGQPPRRGRGRLVSRLRPARRRPQRRARRPHRFDRDAATAVAEARADSSSVTLEDGTEVQLDHGRVVIAAITSCTNTSNLSVMIGAGLLAKRSSAGCDREPGSRPRSRPGSTVVTTTQAGRARRVPGQAGVQLVSYGCTTCIGNSGPLPDEISEAVNDNDLVVCSVLPGSGTSRAHQPGRAQQLPGLAAAVRRVRPRREDGHRPARRPHRPGLEGEPVHLSDIWPSSRRSRRRSRRPCAPTCSPRATRTCSRATSAGAGSTRPRGTGTRGRTPYVRKPSFFEGMDSEPEPVEPIENARVLAVLGDSVTTDHISPAGAIKKDSPAGQWLIDNGVDVRDFNSYGSRRGNQRGDDPRTSRTSAFRSELVEREGGYTRHFPDGEETTIYEAAMSYSPTTACPWWSSPARSTGRGRRGTGRRRGRRCWGSAR